jgi:hypothetical protein
LGESLEIFSVSRKFAYPNLSELKIFVEKFPQLRKSFVRILRPTIQQRNRGIGISLRAGIASEILSYPEALAEEDLLLVGAILSERVSKFWKFFGTSIPPAISEFSEAIRIFRRWISAFPSAPVRCGKLAANTVHDSLRIAAAEFGYEFPEFKIPPEISEDDFPIFQSLLVPNLRYLRSFSFHGLNISDKNLEEILVNSETLNSVAIVACPLVSPSVLKFASPCKNLLLSELLWSKISYEFPTGMSTLVIRNFPNLVEAGGFPEIKRLHFLRCPVLRNFFFSNSENMVNLKTLVLLETPRLSHFRLRALTSCFSALETLVITDRELLNSLTSIWENPEIIWNFVREFNLIPEVFSELMDSEKEELYGIYAFCWDFISAPDDFEIISFAARSPTRVKNAELPFLLEKAAHRNFAEFRKRVPKLLESLNSDSPHLLQTYVRLLWKFFPGTSQESTDAVSIATELVRYIQRSPDSSQQGEYHRIVSVMAKIFGVSTLLLGSKLVSPQSVRRWRRGGQRGGKEVGGAGVGGGGREGSGAAGKVQ